MQWTAPTEKKLTGGNNFTGIRPASSTWAAGAQPQRQPIVCLCVSVMVLNLQFMQ